VSSVLRPHQHSIGYTGDGQTASAPSKSVRTNRLMTALV